MGGAQRVTPTISPLTMKASRKLSHHVLPVSAGFVIWFGSLGLGVLAGRLGRTEKLSIDAGEPGIETFVEILESNLTVALILFAGVVTFGLLSVLYGIVVGLMTGYFIGNAMTSLGAEHVLTHLAPHALIEFTGIAVALGAGVLPAMSLLKQAWSSANSPRPGIKDFVQESALSSFQVFIVACVIVIVAAIVETWITPYVNVLP